MGIIIFFFFFYDGYYYFPSKRVQDTRMSSLKKKDTRMSKPKFKAFLNRDIGPKA